MSFKIAGSIGLQNVVKVASPVIMEPIMKVTVTTPEDFMGDVIGDLNSRRGRIESMEDAYGAKEVIAFVPLENMFGYTTDLRSMSQGRANSVMELDHYAEVPPNIAEEIISKRGKKKED
jgi:elongation factor G